MDKLSLTVLTVLIHAALFLSPLLLFLDAAPAPRWRVPKRPSPVGGWRMHWRGAIYLAVLEADGRYGCTDGAWRWLGRWQLEGDRLTFSEVSVTPEGEEGNLADWHVELEPGQLAGRLFPEGRFRLEK